MINQGLNTEADKASKEGLRLAEGTWAVKEFTNGRQQAYYHRPFIEQPWCLHDGRQVLELYYAEG